MYLDLDNYLSGYFNDDYWYDEGFLIAHEMMLEFDNADWLQLQNEVSMKDADWQEKLAYSIDEDCGKEGLIVLLKLLESTDDEVLVTSIDALRSFQIEKYRTIISIQPKIVDIATRLHDKAGLPVKRILEDFLVKLR